MNKILLATLLAGFGAQVVKLIIYWFRHKTLAFHDLIVTGGMPSSHSAFVVSLATSIYLEEGISPAFAISLVLAIIVIRDAFGVRRTAGKEGLAIQKLFRMHKIQSREHYAMGHSLVEVLVGALLGFMVSLSVFYFL
ncbi:divergent PAP2 family protein [Candidatus Woesearchaeota archaeon]|nr:divergent PAP2 family protein [Candidatus Woesearchaeota archaeon]